jgi:hypothetical protein
MAATTASASATAAPVTTTTTTTTRTGPPQVQNSTVTSNNNENDNHSVLDISEQTQRPVDNAFNQQRINAWHPILDPVFVIIGLFYLGIIMVPTGTFPFLLCSFFFDIKKQLENDAIFVVACLFFGLILPSSCCCLCV